MDSQPVSDSTKAFGALYQAGWSVGAASYLDASGGRVWLVTGRRGEHVIRAEGPNETAAWQGALEQARAIESLERPTDG